MLTPARGGLALGLIPLIPPRDGPRREVAGGDTQLRDLLKPSQTAATPTPSRSNGKGNR